LAVTNQLSDRNASLAFLQHCEDLHFCESGLPHAQSSFVWAPESPSLPVRAIGELTRPAHLPTYRSLLVGPGGELWVVSSALGDGRTEVTIVHPADRIVGRIILPYDLDMLEVGARHLLGTYADELGMPRLAVYYHARVVQ